MIVTKDFDYVMVDRQEAIDACQNCIDIFKRNIEKSKEKFIQEEMQETRKSFLFWKWTEKGLSREEAEKEYSKNYGGMSRESIAKDVYGIDTYRNALFCLESIENSDKQNISMNSNFMRKYGDFTKWGK